MDPNDNRNRRKRGIDRVNDLVNKGRSVYSVGQRGRLLIQATRTLLSMEMIAVIILLLSILALFVAIVATGGGGGASESAEGPGDCKGISGITVDPANLTISAHFPAALETTGCLDDATYTWSDSPKTGNFISSDSNSTVYIPKAVSTGTQNEVISLNVCLDSGACTKFSVPLTVIPDAASITCKASPTTGCLPAGNDYCDKTVSGTCPAASGRSCCTIQAPQSTNFTCPSGNYVGCVREFFNIELTGASAYEQKLVFQSFAFAARSPAYLNLLTNGGILHIKMHYPGYVGCAAVTPSGNEIDIGNCSGISLKGFLHFIIHESGHVIADRNPYLKQQFPLTALESSDPTCYDSLGYMESYPLSGSCSSGKGINSRSESFAEALSYYVTWMYQYNPWQCAQPFKNFKTQCNNTYDWEKQKIYNGFEF